MRLEFLRDFLISWKTRFLEEASTRLNLAASIIQIVSVVGFTLAGYGIFAWVWGLAFTCWLGWIAYVTLPRFLVHPSTLLGSPVEVEELSHLTS
jgi:hypothetical protein